MSKSKYLDDTDIGAGYQDDEGRGRQVPGRDERDDMYKAGGAGLDDMYRVSRYSCHPLVSLCARMERKNRVLNLPPFEITESRTCHPHKMAESKL